MIENLYQHADGDYYCLLSDDAPMKHPDTGEWLEGVIYTGSDGRMRSTSRARWIERFKPVAEYTGDDEAVHQMIRRCNPGESDFDFMRVIESWSQAEMDMTGHMLELAVAAAMTMPVEVRENDRFAVDGKLFVLTIGSADLQRIAQDYEVTRVPHPHAFEFVVRRESISTPSVPE